MVGCMSDSSELFFRTVSVTAAEFVHTAGGIDEFLFSGEEGVRGAGDFKLHEGIFFTVDFNSLLGGYGGTSDEDFVVGHVFEYYLTII